MPQVSIVLPTYNGEKYLDSSIQSIIAQSFTDWELIIVDDCSIDSTLDIAREYEKKDDRIRVIQNEVNSKTPTALNNGFSVAKGNLLTWTSDDNLYEKSALEVMVDYMNNHLECGFAYCDMEIIDEMGNHIKYQRKEPDYLYLGCGVGGCFIYRKEVLEKIGGYNPDFFLIEDYDYWLRISEYFEIHRIDSLEYKFRKHAEAQTYTKARDVYEKLYTLRKGKLPYLLSKINEKYKVQLAIDMYLVEKDIDLLKKFWEGKIPEEIEALIERNTAIDNSKKYAVFGAGDYGIHSLYLLGVDRIAFFVDNSTEKIGKQHLGIPVVDVEFLKQNEKDCNIVVAVGPEFMSEIIIQFKHEGINKYVTYVELLNGIFEF